MLLAFTVFVTLAASPPLSILTTPSAIWDVSVEDVNGDGLQDIVATTSATSASSTTKSLEIFIAKAPARYPSTPSLSVPLEHWSGSVFFAEVDGRAPRELVVAKPDEATWYRFTEGAYVKGGSTSFHSVLPGGSVELLFLEDAAEDLDGDGIDEWIIPGPYGYQLHNAYGLIAKIEGDIDSEIRPYGTPQITLRLPSQQSFVMTSEEQKGLAFLSDTYADFSFGEGWRNHKRHALPLELDDKWDAVTRMDDINNDGFPDLVVTQTRGTLRMKVLTQVYIASAPFVYPKKPTWSLESQGAFSTAYIRDVDGDDDLDIIFLDISLGIRSIVNYFVRGKVSVKASVHLFKSGTYSRKADYKTSLTLDAPDGREQIAFTLGDFNGDGQLDAAFGKTAKKLSVHLGDTKSFLSSKSMATYDVPTFGVGRVYDLNGNDKDDLLLFHPGGDDSRRIDVVAF